MTSSYGPSHAEILTQVELFTHLDRATLAQLIDGIEIIAFDDSALVCREGDMADAIYVVSRGRFGVYATSPDATDEVRIGTFVRGDYFGESILLTDGLPAPTIRAESPGELLRLPRDRALALFHLEPPATHVLSVAARRLISSLDPSRAPGSVERQAWDASAPVLNRMSWALLGLELERLPPDRRQQVLEVSVLEEVTLPALQTLVGENAETVMHDLRDLGVLTPSPTGPSLHALRERFAQEVGHQQAEAQAAAAATRLARAGRWDDTLTIHNRLGDRKGLVDALAIALRDARPLSNERAMFWAQQIQDDEALRDPDVLLIRATLHERDGDPETALILLAQALSSESLERDAPIRERLVAEVARLQLLRDVGAEVSHGAPAPPLLSSLRKFWRSRSGQTR